MYQIDDITCEKIDRANEIIGIITEIIETTPVGQWHFETKDEYWQFAGLAIELKLSPISEVSTFGYRMQAFLLELTELDAMFRENRPKRVLRKQIGLYEKALTKLSEAVEKLPLERMVT